MKQEVEKFLREQDMLSGGIVAGFSGGADSVCLLLVLSELSAQYGFPLHAVHVNHGIRGAQADTDEAFAEAFCKRIGVECHIFREDVPEEAQRTGAGLEEAGRTVRYRRFYETAVKTGAKAIAVAHHMDDNAETVLFRLARGTGIRGLAGIPAVSRPFADEHIALIRPLLPFRRERILAELERRGETYRTDETNADDSYARNRIRNQVMPVLTDINAGVVEHIAAMAAQASALADLLTAEAERVYAGVFRDGMLLAEGMKDVPAIVRTEVLLRFMKELTGVEKDFTEQHAEAADRLLSGPVSKELSLPAGLILEKTYEGIRRKAAGKEDGSETELVPGEYPLGDGRVLSVTVREHFPGETVEKNKWIKWFDYDMINCALTLRTRRKGDFFFVNREGGKKLLKEYYVEAKIPREERDSLLIVAGGPEVMWIPGYRGTERCYVTDRTEKVLVLEVR
ncbi:MAG: tRNA lysidine(34) synthetase TilS [Lachnospiraceae bacterium]|nr:tRNA lysidine(34) synthetase TilS [Lachnospiraceae bacterium]